MAAEPMTIFSSKVDPHGVFKRLKEMAPDPKVTEMNGVWATAEITIGGGVFRKAKSVTFRHAREYDLDPGFPNQIRGMLRYFSRFPQQPTTPMVMRAISAFRFAVTLFPAPEPDLSIDSDDEPRHKAVNWLCGAAEVFSETDTPT